MYMDKSCWMIGCKCMIYHGNELRVGPLGF